MPRNVLQRVPGWGYEVDRSNKQQGSGDNPVPHQRMEDPDDPTFFAPPPLGLDAAHIANTDPDLPVDSTLNIP